MSRPNYFPDTTEYPTSLLIKAAEVYANAAVTGERIPTSTDFRTLFRLTEEQARVIHSAAKFAYDMKQKGLAS